MSSFNNKYFDISTQYALLFGKIESCKQNIENMSKNIPASLESVLRAQIALSNNQLNNQPIVTEIDNDMLCRVANYTYQKMLESERGQELLHKAKKYDIPYKISRINWLKLIDDVHKYERLLFEAEELGIDWDTCVYDPAFLQQEIEQVRYQNLNDLKDMRLAFGATRGLEV